MVPSPGVALLFYAKVGNEGRPFICYRTFFLFRKALQSIRNLAKRNRFMIFEMLINKYLFFKKWKEQKRVFLPLKTEETT